MSNTPDLTPKQLLERNGLSGVLRIYSAEPTREKGIAAVKKALELSSSEAAAREIDRALDAWKDQTSDNPGRVAAEEDARIQHHLRPALEPAVSQGDVNAVRADAELGRERRKIWGADQGGDREGAVVIMGLDFGGPEKAPAEPVIEGEIEPGDGEDSPPDAA